ncbi:hypothetical protein, partial [Rhodococcus sp. 06-462-5]
MNSMLVSLLARATPDL